MTAQIPTDLEILRVFEKNALQKVQELNAFANLLMKEGPKAELFEGIYRATSTMKAFALTCHQTQITNFISQYLDTKFDAIRLQKEELTEENKKNIKEKIIELKTMINKVTKDENMTSVLPATSPITLPIEDNPLALLTSIGQLSVWSFHELMNALAKVHGYSEMLEDVSSKIPENYSNIKNDLLAIQEKLILNTAYMSSVINRIRSLRGKTKLNIQEHNIIKSIKRSKESTQQPTKALQWSELNVPNVNVKFDQVIFEQIWVHLWKLLSQWNTPGVLTQPMCLGRFRANQNTEKNDYKNILNLYLWLQKNESTVIDPKILKYSGETVQVDLANVFHFTNKIAKKIGIELECAQSHLSNTVFSITIPCSDIQEKVSVEVGKFPLGKIHPLQEEKEDLPLKYILIIDDEKDLRTILSLKITKIGYGAVVASSILEAKNMMKEKDIKLIISDLFLGNESGLELFKELKSINSQIPFVFITGQNEDDIPFSIHELLIKYADAFLTKPISTSILKETLTKIVPLF
jgi:CheY-like chemotaxis protein